MKNTKDKISIFESKQVLYLLVCSILLIVYVFPQGMLKKYLGTDLSIDKMLFSAIAALFFLLNKIYTMRLPKSQLVFLLLSIVFTILYKDVRCLLFIYLPLLEDLIPYKNSIVAILKRSKILYVCLLFTIFYSILYPIIGVVDNGRLAFSAIAEINQSGLAIFGLAVLMMLKNKSFGYLIMLFGLLTISRSYYLATIMYMLSKLKIVRNLIGSIKHWWIFRYWVLVLLSSVLLIFIGMFYIHQNSLGNVYWGDDTDSRLTTLLDYSNLFRFVTNISLVMIYLRSPVYLMTGLDDTNYHYEAITSYSDLGLPYKSLDPHNLFFSHLRIYGLFTLAEMWYIDKTMSKLVNKKNLMIFLAMFLYSIILGAGLYSYWIFISFFAMSSEETLYAGKKTAVNEKNKVRIGVYTEGKSKDRI